MSPDSIAYLRAYCCELRDAGGRVRSLEPVTRELTKFLGERRR